MNIDDYNEDLLVFFKAIKKIFDSYLDPESVDPLARSSDYHQGRVDTLDFVIYHLEHYDDIYFNGL